MRKPSLIVFTLLTVAVLGVNYIFLILPAQTSNSVPSLFSQLEQLTLEENWPQATSVYTEITRKFDRLKYIIMLNNAEQEFNDFESSLQQIRGGLLARDKASVLTQLAVAQSLWTPITQLVPRP